MDRVDSYFQVLERNWWALALRGLVAALFGLFILIRPQMAFVALVALFGAWWLVDGLLAVTAALFGAERRTRWWPLVAEGVTGILLGGAVYLVPGITVFALLMIVAAWAVITGALRMYAAARLRSVAEGEWLLLGSGVVSVLFGLLVLFSPETGVIALTLTVGVFALIHGGLMLLLAARLYGWRRWHETHPMGA